MGVAAAVALLAVVGIFLRGWTQRRLAEEEQRKIFAPSLPEVDAYRAEQEALLGGYGWEDRDQGLVRLPIERAMNLVVAEHSKGGSQ
jgi:hypothetical protein